MRLLFSRIPAAALRRDIDGHVYALVPHRLRKGAILEDYENPSMVRYGPESFTKGGEAHVLIGKLGDRLPLPRIPFGVTVIREG